MGKTIGIILMAGGTLVGIIITWLGSIYRGEGSLTAGAAALGIALGLLLFALPQIGFGLFLWLKGSQTEKRSGSDERPAPSSEHYQNRGAGEP